MRKVELVPAELGTDAVLIGAGSLALRGSGHTIMENA
jgi:hypothetical protein